MLHLHPYGIFLDIDPATKTRPIPRDVRLSKAVHDGETIAMLDESGAKVHEFRMLEPLGTGSFSEVFATDTPIDGMDTVVKRIRVSHHSAEAIVTEALLQILVVKATEHYDEDGRKGPFAPRFFRIGVDEEYYYMISERIYATLKEVVAAVKKPSALMHLFIEVAHIMKILWDILEFNHRDMKFDNIMMDATGKIRIVDFGFSCLKYEHTLQVVSTYSNIRKTFNYCDLRSRDMKTFFHYFLHHSKFRGYFTDHMRLKGRVCPLKRIIEALMFSDHEKPTNWEGTYPAYNAEGNLPNMFPETVVNVLQHLKFVDTEDICSEIDPSWVEHIGELNKGLLKTLTKEELRRIPKEHLLEYLKTYPSIRLLEKIESGTNDEEIRAFCKEGLKNPDLFLNTPTRKGGRRARRKTRRVRVKGGYLPPFEPPSNAPKVTLQLDLHH